VVFGTGGAITGRELFAKNGGLQWRIAPTFITHQDASGSLTLTVETLNGSRSQVFQDADGEIALVENISLKAFAQFNATSGTTHAATYSRSGTTVTVSSTAHGHLVGHVVSIDFTSGGAADGIYTVITVPDDNSYTVTTVASGVIAAGSTMNELRRTINSSYGVHSVTYIAVGTFHVNFSTAMADTGYGYEGSCHTTTTGGFLWGGTGTTPAKSTTACPVIARTVALGLFDFTDNTVSFYR
jgi:hypothetical protein